MTEVNIRYIACDGCVPVWDDHGVSADRGSVVRLKN